MPGCYLLNAPATLLYEVQTLRRANLRYVPSMALRKFGNAGYQSRSGRRKKETAGQGDTYGWRARESGVGCHAGRARDSTPYGLKSVSVGISAKNNAWLY